MRTTGAPSPDPVGALRRLLPAPLAEVGDVLAAIGVARHAGQAALNALIRTGELRLAHNHNAIVVVATAEDAP